MRFTIAVVLVSMVVRCRAGDGGVIMVEKNHNVFMVLVVVMVKWW